ncbi:MAG: DNA gyrase inhibitor YacG [Rhizobiaceae bacterium]
MAKQAKSRIEPLRKPRPCPVCEKASSRADYPFCSPQCADADLDQWLSQGYSIPATEDDDAFAPQDSTE